MATNMDKGAYAAPQGLEELAASQDIPEIEISIDNPDSVEIGIDGLTIELAPGAETDEEFNANLAEFMDSGALTEVAGDLLGEFDSDISSRKEWLDTYVDGIELLGMKVEDRTEPWPVACAVYHPLLAEALVKFQAETMMETFPAAGPVKTQIIGKLVSVSDCTRADSQYGVNRLTGGKTAKCESRHTVGPAAAAHGGPRRDRCGFALRLPQPLRRL